jgi:hypothetical protein
VFVCVCVFSVVSAFSLPFPLKSAVLSFSPGFAFY